MPLDDLQAAGGVPGHRAEPHVVGYLDHRGEAAAQAAVRPTVRVAGRVQGAAAQVRFEQVGQDALGLLGAGGPAVEHRLGDPDRVAVPPLPGQPPHLPAGIAGGAVGEPVTRAGQPFVVPGPGGLLVADVPGDQVPQRVHGMRAVPAGRPAPLHVRQHLVYPLKRRLRYRQQRGHGALELPQQGEAALRVVDRVAVELGQAPGERVHRLGRFAAVDVTGGTGQPGLERQHRVPARVGLGDDLLDERRPVPTEGQLLRLAEKTPQTFLRVSHRAPTVPAAPGARRPLIGRWSVRLRLSFRAAAADRGRWGRRALCRFRRPRSAG